MQSATWAEQPVVADVDNDGHADIVVTVRPLHRPRRRHAASTSSRTWPTSGRARGGSGTSTATTSPTSTRTARSRSSRRRTGSCPGLNSFRLNAFVPGETRGRLRQLHLRGERRRARLERGDRAHRRQHAQQRAALHLVAADNGRHRRALRLRRPGDRSRCRRHPDVLAADGADRHDDRAERRSHPVDADCRASWAATTSSSRCRTCAACSRCRATPSQVAAPVTRAGRRRPAPGDGADRHHGGRALVVGAIGTRTPVRRSPPGAVISQTPSAGALVARGTPVSLVGLARSSAGRYGARRRRPVAELPPQADITAAGFVVGPSPASHSAIVPLGVVISQAPPAAPPRRQARRESGRLARARRRETSTSTATASPATRVTATTPTPRSNPGAVDIAGRRHRPELQRAAIRSRGDTTPPTASIDCAGGGCGRHDADGHRRHGDRRATSCATRWSCARDVDAGAHADRRGHGASRQRGARPARSHAARERHVPCPADSRGRQRPDQSIVERAIPGGRDGEGRRTSASRSSISPSRSPAFRSPSSAPTTAASRPARTSASGWTLERQARARSSTTGRPGEAGRSCPAATSACPCQIVSETATHLTEVRLSDFESYRFALTLSNPAAR